MLGDAVLVDHPLHGIRGAERAGHGDGEALALRDEDVALDEALKLADVPRQRWRPNQASVCGSISSTVFTTDSGEPCFSTASAFQSLKPG
jgi:hypothetical protein